MVKIAQKNYRNLRNELYINKKDSRELIESTHGFCGSWKLYPYAIEELIEYCKSEDSLGTDALNFIKLNYKNRAIEIGSIVMGESDTIPNIMYL